MFDFTQQIAVVTGASGALGGVVARRLLDCGARLILPARNPGRLRSRFASGSSELIEVLECAITDAESVAAFAGVVAERHGGAQLLVNVAGGFRGGTPVAETPLEVWDEMMAANARSTFLICRALLPGMLRRGEGAIVNIGSRAAERGGASVAAYSAAKAAVLRVTESLAAEIIGTGLRANCVLPSTIDTPANRAAMPDADRSTWVQPEAVADVILFLLSPLSRALNGAALPV